MLEGAILVWFVLTGGSLLFLTWDLLTNSPVSWVQKLAWFLVVAYMGPVGLVVFLVACRRPFPGGHDAATKAIWKQGLNSEVHCLAGDAAGVVVGSVIVYRLHLSNGWDLTVEYIFGFVCGLFIFQALMMLGMFNGSYAKALVKSFFPEGVSMNFIMAGMVIVMVPLASVWPDSMDPSQYSFWFRMSLASIAGYIVAFPINYWLVKNKLKHGCMTLPGADGPAVGLGHRSSEPSRVIEPDPHHSMQGMDRSDRDMKSDPDMKDIDGSDPKAPAGHDTGGAEGTDMSGHEGRQMGHLSTGTQTAWLVGTFAFFILVTFIVGRFVPISFSTAQGDSMSSESVETTPASKPAGAVPHARRAGIGTADKSIR